MELGLLRRESHHDSSIGGRLKDEIEEAIGHECGAVESIFSLNIYELLDHWELRRGTLSDFGLHIGIDDPGRDCMGPQACLSLFERHALSEPVYG